MRVALLAAAAMLVACGGTAGAPGAPQDGGAAVVDAGELEGDGAVLVDAGNPGDANYQDARDAGDFSDGDAGNPCASDKFSNVLCYGTSAPDAGAGYSSACPQPAPDCVWLVDVANPPVWCCP